jgi:MYXO-CTERM domain-containing protein
MRFTRLAAAFCGVAMVSGSAQAALTFSLERVASNAGAAGPSTVLLVARDPDAASNVSIAGVSGNFKDITTNNGLKFYVPDTDAGDVDTTGGVNNTGFGVDASGNSLRKPLIMGTFLDVPSRTAIILRGTAPDGTVIDNANDPRYQTGMQAAQIISTRTSNTVMSAAALKSADGAILGAAVVGSALDDVTFTGGSFGVVDANGNALPDVTIADLSTAAVPEPTALGLAGVAVVGLARRRRKA